MLTQHWMSRAVVFLAGGLLAALPLSGCSTGETGDGAQATADAVLLPSPDAGPSGSPHADHGRTETTADAVVPPSPDTGTPGSGQADPASRTQAGPSGGTPVTSIDIDWSPLPGEMSGVGVGGMDDWEGIWALGAISVRGGHPVHYWNGDDWDVLDQGAVAVAVDRDGYPWIVDPEQRILTWTGTEWERRPGTARDIGTGADGSVWIVGTDPAPGGFGIHRWTETDWEQVPGGAVAIAVRSLGDPSVTRQAEPWVVDDRGRISRWTGSDWEVQPGEAQDIGIGANGAVWIIGVTPAPGGYTIATWNGGGWASAPGGAVQISVNANGFPFVVTDDGRLLRGR